MKQYKNQVFIFIQGAGDRNTFISVAIIKKLSGSLENYVKCSHFRNVTSLNKLSRQNNWLISSLTLAHQTAQSTYKTFSRDALSKLGIRNLKVCISKHKAKANKKTSNKQKNPETNKTKQKPLKTSLGHILHSPKKQRPAFSQCCNFGGFCVCVWMRENTISFLQEYGHYYLDKIKYLECWPSLLTLMLSQALSGQHSVF